MYVGTLVSTLDIICDYDVALQKPLIGLQEAKYFTSNSNLVSLLHFYFYIHDTLPFYILAASSV